MFNKILIIASVCVTSLITSAAPQTPRLKVRPEYRKNYASTCAIGTMSIFGQDIRGTGVLLKSGYVITNRHVVDLNRNGKIDRREEYVDVVFMYPKARTCVGRAILIGAEYDLAIIYVKNGPVSSVELAEDGEYKRMRVGDEVYALGYPLGVTPAHMTTGVYSGHLSNMYHRHSAQIYFGNSGGGVFSKDNGLLLGINTRVPSYMGRIVPGWSEYIPATQVRKFLRKNKKLFLLLPKKFL